MSALADADLAVPRGRRRWPGVPALLGLAITSQFLPLAVGVVVGAAGPARASTVLELSWVDVLAQNLRVGLVLLIAGWLSAGTATLALSAYGAALSGIGVGASLNLHGWASTVASVPHFGIEMIGLSAFAGAGLAGGWFVAQVIRGRPFATAWQRSAVVATWLSAAGVGCLVLAAVVEATAF